MDAGKEDATIDMVKLPMNKVLLTLVEERRLQNPKRWGKNQISSMHMDGETECLRESW